MESNLPHAIGEPGAGAYPGAQRIAWEAPKPKPRPLVCVIGLAAPQCDELYSRVGGRSFRIVVLTGEAGKGAEERPHFRVVRIWRWGRRAAILHAAAALVWARLAVNPEIVLLCGAGALFTTPMARLLGFRALATLDDVDLRDAPASSAMAALCAHRIVCTSASVYDRLVGRFPFAAKRACAAPTGAARASAGGAFDPDTHARFIAAQLRRLRR